jgi:hypothetical protein
LRARDGDRQRAHVCSRGGVDDVRGHALPGPGEPFDLKHDGDLAECILTLGIDLFCSIAAFLLERHSQQTEIKTVGSALFWTTTQLLTVSSQIKNPISAAGRVLMEIWAITVVATLADAFGSFLQKRGQDGRQALTGRTRPLRSGGLGVL